MLILSYPSNFCRIQTKKRNREIIEHITSASSDMTITSLMWHYLYYSPPTHAYDITSYLLFQYGKLERNQCLKFLLRISHYDTTFSPLSKDPVWELLQLTSISIPVANLEIVKMATGCISRHGSEMWWKTFFLGLHWWLGHHESAD
jgi:hypothetical protein